MWARGLKQVIRYNVDIVIIVAPHVGAWIETQTRSISHFWDSSRAPCGRVD